MAIVTRKERTERRMDALSKIEKGWGWVKLLTILSTTTKLPEDPQIWMFNGHQLS